MAWPSLTVRVVSPPGAPANLILPVPPITSYLLTYIRSRAPGGTQKSPARRRIQTQPETSPPFNLATASGPLKHPTMPFAFPTSAERDSPASKTQQPRHAFPTAPHAPRAQPPPFRRRTSTLSSMTSTSTTASTTSLPTHTAASTPGPPRPLSPDEAGPPGAIVWLNGFPGVGKLTIAQWLHRLLGTDRSVILDHQSQLAHANGAGGAGAAALLPPTPEVEITDPFFALPGAAGTAGGGGGGRGRRGTGSSLPELVNRPENARRTVIVTSCVLSPGLKDEKEKGEEVDGEKEEQGEKVEQGGPGSEEAAVSAAKQCLADSLDSNRPFLPVYLTCQEEENMRRVQSLERRYSSSSSLPPPPSSSTTPTRPPLSYPSPPTSRDRVNRASLARNLRNGRDLFLFDGVKSLDLNVTDLEAHQAAMDILGFVNSEVERWHAKHAS